MLSPDVTQHDEKIRHQISHDESTITMNTSTIPFTMHGDNDDKEDDRSVSVVLFCGLPASGKSSFISKLIQVLHSTEEETNDDHAQLYDDILLIDYDQITETEIQKLNENDTSAITTATTSADTNIDEHDTIAAWNQTRSNAISILEQKLTDFYSNTEKKRLLIILDDNFHLRSMRKQIFKSCQKFVMPINEATDDLSTQIIETTRNNTKIYFCVATINTPLQICLERNRRREGFKRVPDHVIHKMSQIIQIPTPNNNNNNSNDDINDENVSNNDNTIKHWENYQYIHTIQQNFPPNDSCYDEQIENFIRSFCSQIHTDKKNGIKPIPPPIDYDELEQEEIKRREIDRKIIDASHSHKADLILRHLVGVTCKTASSVTLKSNKGFYAKRSNMAKKTILSDLKKNPKTKFVLLEKDIDNSNEDDEIIVDWEKTILEPFLSIVLTTTQANNRTEENDENQSSLLKIKIEQGFHSFFAK